MNDAVERVFGRYVWNLRHLGANSGKNVVGSCRILVVGKNCLALFLANDNALCLSISSSARHMSPGTDNGVPYNISAVDAPMSSLGMFLSPKSTLGSFVTQSLLPANWDLNAALNVRWKCSTIPLDCGW